VGHRPRRRGHDLRPQPDSQSHHPARFERSAANIRIRASALPEFRQFLNREGQVFLERVDDWLIRHEAGPEPTEDTLRLGTGVYHIQD
jgi:hypothetical protein